MIRSAGLQPVAPLPHRVSAVRREVAAAADSSHGQRSVRASVTVRNSAAACDSVARVV